ncbi:MAG: hypothetical protein KatS3mg068_0263 [Candidatus Sericytochromatia bacterium]|nr:MAG: hypothetical protein KatS3mg068_0263 [Candidatus Sericytochromatia bacterium]
MLRILFFFFILIIYSCGGRLDDNIPQVPNGTDLTIRVIDRSQVKPIPNAKVSLKRDEQLVGKEQITDEEGKVIFKNIPEGDNYRAFVTSALGYKTAASSLINVIKGSPNNVASILLDKITQGEGSGLIVGSVKNRTTKLPIFRALVTYVGPNNSGLGRQYFTDENGSFIIEGLIPGQYIVTISYGNAKEQKRVVVNDGQTTNIETIFLQVNNPKGNFLISLNGEKKIIEIDKTGKINWSYNQLKGLENSVKTSSGQIFAVDNVSSKIVQIDFNSSKTTNNIILDLKQASWVDAINDDTILITDTQGNKVIEYSKGKISWNYSNLLRPRSAIYIPNGNILISDMGNKRILEVDKKNKIVWEYNQNMDKPSYSIRLTNGNTLITDTGYSRILEVSPDKKVVWWYSGIVQKNNPSNDFNNGIDFNYPIDYRNIKSTAQEEPYTNPGNDLLFPRQAIKLNNNNILISDTGNNRIIEVSKDKKIVWELNNLFRPISIGLL